MRIEVSAAEQAEEEHAKGGQGSTPRDLLLRQVCQLMGGVIFFELAE